MNFKFRFEKDNKIYLARNYQSFANHFNIKVAKIKYMLKTEQITIDKVNITLQDIIRDKYNFKMNPSGVVIMETKPKNKSQNSSENDTNSKNETHVE